MRKLKIEDFIYKANKIHNFKYDYSKVEYISSRKKVIIICKKHGEFLQTPDCHLHNSGCKYCSDKLHVNDFISAVNTIHNNLYDYSLINFVNVSTKIKIKCLLHGVFEQTPNHHLHKKQGCPKCNRVGTSKEKWIKSCLKNKNAQLYIIRCFNNEESFIKIGITSKSVIKRFYNKKILPYNFEVIKTITGSPEFIWNKEKELHKKYSFFKYKPLISFAGETECFNIQIISDL